MVAIHHNHQGHTEMSRNIRWSLNILPFLVALLLVTAIPRLEAFFLPVVHSFTVTSVTRTGDVLMVKGYMRKDRDCSFVGVSATGIGNDAKVAIPLVFRDGAYDNTGTRPTGTQSWGPWTLHIPVAPQIHSIDMDATHACHPLWTTRTHLVSIPVIGVGQ